MDATDLSNNSRYKLIDLVVAIACSLLINMTSCTGGESLPVQDLKTEVASVQPATIGPTLIVSPTVMPTQKILDKPVIAHESIQFSKKQCPATIEEYGG